MQKKSKKGVTTLLEVLIGVLLGLIVVAFLAYLSAEIFGVAGFEKSDDVSFNDLTKAIAEVKAGESGQIIYSISGKHFLVGFGKEDDSVKIEGTSVEKPKTLCKNNACVCKCNLLEGEFSFNSCFNGKCSVVSDVAEIKGLVLLGEGLDEVRQPAEKLVIKGRNALPLAMAKKDNALVFSMPGISK